MVKLFLCLAAINGFMAVAIGAFGAHGLKGKLAENLISAFHTGVQYHFYHTLALFGVGLLMQRAQNTGLFEVSGWLFLIGIVLFCGSLYALALGGPSWLGPVTPLGGLSFLAAWIVLFVGAYRLA